LSFKDITFEDKNLGSLKFGLLKKIELNRKDSFEASSKFLGDDNFIDYLKNKFNNLLDSKENLINTKKNNSRTLIISLGFKLDRPLYGADTTNTFSNRNFINFILGLENNRFSFLTKLKLPDYDAKNIQSKIYFKYKLEENAYILFDFFYDRKNNNKSFNIGTELFSEDDTRIRINFNEKNEISQQIITRYNDKVNFHFKYCISLPGDISHSTDNLNPRYYLNSKFGVGVEYNTETNLGNTNNTYLKFAKYEKERSASDIFSDSFNSFINSIKKIVKSIDLY